MELAVEERHLEMDNRCPWKPVFKWVILGLFFVYYHSFQAILQTEKCRLIVIRSHIVEI